MLGNGFISIHLHLHVHIMVTSNQQFLGSKYLPIPVESVDIWKCQWMTHSLDVKDATASKNSIYQPIANGSLKIWICTLFCQLPFLPNPIHQLRWSGSANSFVSEFHWNAVLMQCIQSRPTSTVPQNRFYCVSPQTRSITCLFLKITCILCTPVKSPYTS